MNVLKNLQKYLRRIKRLEKIFFELRKEKKTEVSIWKINSIKKKLQDLRREYKNFLLANKIITEEDSYPYNVVVSRWIKQKKDNNNEKLKTTRRFEKKEEAQLKAIYSRLKQRHLIKHIGKVLTFDELCVQYEKQEKRCFYSRLPFSCLKVDLAGINPQTISVDRIDSSIGYTVENTVLCCWFVNCAKNSWKINEMIPLWEELVKHSKNI